MLVRALSVSYWEGVNTGLGINVIVLDSPQLNYRETCHNQLYPKNEIDNQKSGSNIFGVSVCIS